MKKKTDRKTIIGSSIFGCAAALGIAGILGFNALSGNSGKAFAEGSGNGQEGLEEQRENGWEAANRDTEYVYCVGSVSKIYSTAAVMRLAEEGKVVLDAPVTDYIPEFRMEDPRYKDITVRMLMDHTSGLMGSTYFGAYLYEDQNEDLLDQLPEHLAGQRLKADPGEYASYCNDGFDLLALITQRVSGMDYTEYVKKYLMEPTGGDSTGSGVTYLSMKDLAPAYTAGHVLYEQGGTQVIGAGGIYATASDTARFGSAFFAGNKSILSEASKAAMAAPWSDKDIYMDENGLGWDFVSVKRYGDAGIKVLGKGGDALMNHAFLLVAPEEQISVSVLTNGGTSTLNGLMAEAILDVCLEEEGIQLTDPSWPAAAGICDIPEEYDALAGAYAVSGMEGAVINKITFPEHKYMHVESIGPYKTTCQDFALTEDGRFADLAYEVEDGGTDQMRFSLNPMYISFQTDADGKILLAADRNTRCPGIGEQAQHLYIGEKMDGDPACAEAEAFVQKVSGREFLICSERPSSSAYDMAFLEVVPAAEFPGYVFVINSGLGTRLLKITDATHAAAFTDIPSSRNRDLMDGTLKEDEDGLKLVTSNGLEFISEENIPYFDASLSEIAFVSDAPAWFKIGKEMANAEIAITDMPEHSAVYVYNKFGEVVYTTHVKGMTDILPMPEGGRIVFLGRDGESIRLTAG
ncbi:MAG: beta-lactamase family protein [Lachnospiraceae bacterium]|nr:beta-lactamase family protein [Lachnospiraceae bacterium]